MYQFMTLKSERGSALIQMMVAAAIGTVILGVTTSVLNRQSQEAKALTEKIASLELAREVTANLAVGANCSRLFGAGNLISGPADLTYVSANVSANRPHIIDLRAVPGPAGSTAIAQPNQAVSPLSSTLRVAPANGIQVLVTSPTKGELAINFDQSRLTRSLRNLNFPINFTTTLAGGSRTITGCSAAVDDVVLADVCQSIGGTFNTSANPPCSLPSTGSGNNCSGPVPACGIGCPSGMGNLGQRVPVCGANGWVCVCP